MKYKLRENFPKDETCLTAILKHRGVENVQNFLRPSQKDELDYKDLDNIDAGVKMLAKHLRNDSRILIIVDADVDGLTSSAIIWLYIKNLFPKADLTFTVHDGKQHGLEDKIDWLIGDEQFDLVICPDSASNDIAYMEQLKKIDTEVLVLDHHLCEYGGYDCVPSSAVVINNQQSKNYSNKYLCGAGVVYKFCEALDDYFGIKKAHDFIDLAALGEIADVMSKTNCETNYIMEEGLCNIKNGGIRALIEEQCFSLKDKARYPYNGLTTTDIAFYIAPLLNAIVRVGSLKENETAFLCFVEPDLQVPSTKRGAKEGDYETAAKQTARVGKNCKAKQDRIKTKAMDLIDFKIQKDNLLKNRILLIELEPNDDIPTSMTGLIAQNCVSKYGRPTLIGRKCPDNCLRGSIRGNEHFSAVPDLKEYLLSTGNFELIAGHANAAGYTLPFKNQQHFIDFTNSDLDENAFENTYQVDYVFQAIEPEIKTVGNIIGTSDRYFGNNIDEVKVVIKGIELGNIFVMGADKSSIKISYNGIDYVKFKDLDFIEQIQSNRMKNLNVIARFNVNEFMGHKSLQCFIEDYELVENNARFDF